MNEADINVNDVEKLGDSCIVDNVKESIKEAVTVLLIQRIQRFLMQ